MRPGGFQAPPKVAIRFSNPRLYFQGQGGLIHIQGVDADLGHVLKGQRGLPPRADGAIAGA